MKNYVPIMSFGEDVARLDRDFQRGDELAAVAFLEHLAGPGPALELGIGTGRIALPLAAHGIRVEGIDLSEAMVNQLSTEPGGDQLSVTIGNFATTRRHRCLRRATCPSPERASEQGHIRTLPHQAV